MATLETWPKESLFPSGPTLPRRHPAPRERDGRALVDPTPHNCEIASFFKNRAVKSVGMSDHEKKILHRVEKPDRGSAENHPDFLFWCPGCECAHGIWTTRRNSQNALWTFDGDLQKPSFQPSLLIRSERGVCHSFVKEGQIIFLTDCTHALAGRTVPMEPF